MTLRDYGKIKWNSASFIPLAFKMEREMFKGQTRTAKLILDKNQTEEFDLRIAYGTEYNYCDKANYLV